MLLMNSKACSFIEQACINIYLPKTKSVKCLMFLFGFRPYDATDLMNFQVNVPPPPGMTGLAAVQLAVSAHRHVTVDS